MPRTEAGIKCPGACKGKGVTEYVALVPRVAGEQVVPAGSWACCMACYKAQWAEVYGARFGGIGYDAYLARQAAGEPGF